MTTLLTLAASSPDTFNDWLALGITLFVAACAMVMACVGKCNTKF